MLVKLRFMISKFDAVQSLSSLNQFPSSKLNTQHIYNSVVNQINQTLYTIVHIFYWYHRYYI